MKLGYDGLRLRIFVHEATRHHGWTLYEYLVDEARRDGLAGATVFRGIEGFGQHHHLHTTRLLDASDVLPIMVELIDRPDVIRRFLVRLDEVIARGAATISPIRDFPPVLDDMITEGMITTSEVEIVTYRPGR